VSEIYTQQYYRSRDPWPPTDGFRVMVDDQVELDTDTLLEAVEFMAALAVRLEGLDAQQEFNLTEK